MECEETGKSSSKLHQELFAEHRVVIQKIIAEHSERAMEAIAMQIGTLQRKTAEFDVKIKEDSEAREGKVDQGSISETDANVSTQPLLQSSPNAVPGLPQVKADMLGKKRSVKDMMQDSLSTRTQQKNRRSRPTRMSRIFEDNKNDKNEQEFVPQGVFADAEAMKQKLRKALAKPAYDVTSFYKKTGWCQMLARSTIIGNTTLCVIAFNALWIAVDVDHNPASILVDADPIFQVVDHLFCLYFSFEILIRFGSFEKKNNCLKDGWFVFDAFMAASMAIETWVVSLIVIVFSIRSGTDTGDASLLKIFRLFRLVRMARVIRLLNALPELMVVIKGLAVATRAVSCTVILMLLVVYVFAVAFRQITDGTRFGRTHFKTVPLTMRFLLLHGTMADVADVAVAFFEENFMYAMMFLFFILMVTITIMNMLVGVLVGVVSTVASVEQEQLLVNFVKTNLERVLMTVQSADMDNNGMISKEEFAKMLNTPEAVNAFDMMGVDPLGLVDLSDFIFDGGRELPFPDFIEMCMQLRGSNQATVKDIVDLRKFMFMELKNIKGTENLNMTDAERTHLNMTDAERTFGPTLSISKKVQLAPTMVPQTVTSPEMVDPEPIGGSIAPIAGEEHEAPTNDEAHSGIKNRRRDKDWKKSKITTKKSAGLGNEEKPPKQSIHQRGNTFDAANGN